jgi:hypothetical protein
MALDLAKITQNAVGAATKAGVTAPITITRPAPPPNPLTGVQTGSTTTQTLNAVQAQARKSAKKNDAAWTAVTTVLFVAAADLTFTPQRADLVAYAGRTARIEMLEEYAPNGVALGYFLGLA